MNSSQQALHKPAMQVLHALRTKGVKLWVENGALKYRAPRGALDPSDIDKLRAARSGILQLLSAEKSPPPALPALLPRRDADKAPLTFSQRAYWHSARLSEQPSYRHLVAAIRLKGILDLAALQSSLNELVKRHEALRTCIDLVDGTPMQLIAQTGSCILSIDDLPATPEAAWDTQLRELIDAEVLEPVYLAVGPLFAGKLIRLTDLEHVVVLSMEHMISDGASLQVLVRDLFAIYGHLRHGTGPQLPPISVQFGDYAAWLADIEHDWLARHEPYWRDRLAGFGRLRSPARNSIYSGRDGWGTISLQIEAPVREQLQAWSRAQRTTLVMSVFTAYVALMLRWYEVPEAVLRYQTDGRFSPVLQNAVGYFATVLHLRAELRCEDSFIDLLNRITSEYCNAQAHADHSWVEATVPERGFVRNGRFNWVPHAPSNGFDSMMGPDLSCSDFPFENAVLRKMNYDSDPVVLLYDSGTEVVGAVHYSLADFDDRLMERFAASFKVILGAMLQGPGRRVMEVALL